VQDADTQPGLVGVDDQLGPVPGPDDSGPGHLPQPEYVHT
jgi:hypothetical protein